MPIWPIFAFLAKLPDVLIMNMQYGTRLGTGPRVIVEVHDPMPIVCEFRICSSTPLGVFQLFVTCMMEI